jgi:flagellar motor component MotA
MAIDLREDGVEGLVDYIHNHNDELLEIYNRSVWRQGCEDDIIEAIMDEDIEYTDEQLEYVTESIWDSRNAM